MLRLATRAGVAVIVVVLALGLMARAPRGGSDRATDRPRYDLHLAVEALRRWKDEPSVVRIEIWENEKRTYGKEWREPGWSRTLKVFPGTKVELKVYFVDSVIEATCTIYDDNGNVYDAQDEIFTYQNLKNPVTCVASIL